MLTRTHVIRTRGEEYFKKTFLPKFSNVTVGGLLLTLVLIFSFQGPTILNNPLHIALIAVPLIIQTYLIFFIALLSDGQETEAGPLRCGAGRYDRSFQLLRTLGSPCGHFALRPLFTCGAGNHCRRTGRGARNAEPGQVRQPDNGGGFPQKEKLTLRPETHSVKHYFQRIYTGDSVSGYTYPVKSDQWVITPTSFFGPTSSQVRAEP